MAWGQFRARLVRAAGVAQLAALTGLSASWAAALTRPLWREARPGCAAGLGLAQPGTLVSCAPPGLHDGAPRWPAFAAGVLLAVLAAASPSRHTLVLRLLTAATIIWGLAAYAADEIRYAGAHTLICIDYGYGCADPVWHRRDLLAGAAVGLALTVLSLTAERATRNASRAARLEPRRVMVGTLATCAVPVGLLGLMLLPGDEDAGGPQGEPLVAGALGLSVAALLLRHREQPQASVPTTSSI